MKLATTARLPKKTSAKVNGPDNPAWTADMLGAPVVKRGHPRLIHTRFGFHLIEALVEGIALETADSPLLQ